MALSAEEIAAAEKLHRFVRGCEKHPIAPVCVAVSLGVVGAMNLWRNNVFGNQRADDAFLGLILSGVVGTVIGQFVRQRRYRQSRVLLAILERDHGDELPWIKEEREAAKVEEHLKAVRAIQREVSGKQAV